MFFMPLLVGLMAYLAYPSVILAVALAILVWAYLRFGGMAVSGSFRANARAQVAYRILSVKLLSLNGEMAENTYHVHAKLTPDEAETSELRSSLRNAAYTVGDGWKDYARQVKKILRHAPLLLLDRYEFIIVQLKASPGGITDESQDRLIELGKLWGIGGQKARTFLAEMQTAPSERMSAW